MRLFVYSLLLFFSTKLYSQTVTIDSYGNYHPQIEINNEDKPVVLWTDNTTKNLYFAKYDGSSFNTPIAVNPSGLQVQSYDWSGADLSIWNNNIYVTFHSLGYEDGHAYLVKSTDNGATFGDTVRIDNLAVGFAQYPDIAVYNDTVFATFMKHDANGMNPEYVVARSTDGGASFETEVSTSALLGDEVCDCCQPEIVANDEYVVVLFRNNASNIRDIKAAVSYDRGASFTKIIHVDDHQWYIQGCPSVGPDAHLGDDDMLYTVYKSSDSGTGKIFFNQYNLAGDSLVSEIEIKSFEAYTPNYPQLAIDGNNMAVVWEGTLNSKDIYYNTSAFGTNGFNNIYSKNATDTSYSQSKPDVAYLNGSFYIVYASGSSLYMKTVGFVTGIQESKDASFSFYPNPAKNEMSIEFDASFVPQTISVIDALGRTVINESVTNNTKHLLSLYRLDSGTYILQLTNEEQSTTTSFVKQ